METIQRWLPLFKLRIVALLVFVAIVTAAVANGGMPPVQVLSLIAAAGGLASAGASILNQYLDRDTDALMERTRGRPLPSHSIQDPRRALLLGVMLVALSIPISLRLSVQSTFYTLAGAFTYVIVYTLWLKRRSAWNVVVGGLAGSFAILVGWFAVRSQLSLEAILMALILFLWTPMHFWCFAMFHQEDYRRAGLPMLPVVVGDKTTSRYILGHTSLVLAVSLLLAFLGPFRLLYLLTSIVLGGLVLLFNLGLLREPLRRVAWRNYKFSGIYLSGLFLAMFIDTVL